MKKHSGINGNVKNALELSKAIECYTLTRLNFMHINYPSMTVCVNLFMGNFAYNSLQSLASNVTGITVPLSGHWIPEEAAQFVIDQLFKFFAANSTKTK